LVRKLFGHFEYIDRSITHWMARNGIFLLRISIGLIFLWFGILKFVPGASPVEDFTVSSIEILSFGMVPVALGLPVLAFWECLIGIGMFVRRYMRFTILMLYVQMIGVFSPMVTMPEVVFESFPFALSLEGQYIVKNVVVIAAALVIGATVRGGELKAEP